MTGQSALFPLNKLLVFMVSFGLHGVAASSLIGLHDRVLTSVVTPLFKRSNEILPFQNNALNLFHIGLRVFLFMHALVILLIIEAALHDRSAIVFVRRIFVLFCSFEFSRFFRFSISSTPWVLFTANR